MKLIQIAVATVLSAALIGPVFAKGGIQDPAEAQLEEMQGDAVKAGSTDAARVSYWNTMKPEKQKAWQQHCAYTASDAANAQKDTAERQAFCKNVPSQ
jgi:hypothetical protein